jgi:hypothetical protein
MTDTYTRNDGARGRSPDPADTARSPSLARRPPPRRTHSGQPPRSQTLHTSHNPYYHASPSTQQQHSVCAPEGADKAAAFMPERISCPHHSNGSMEGSMRQEATAAPPPPKWLGDVLARVSSGAAWDKFLRETQRAAARATTKLDAGVCSCLCVLLCFTQQQDSSAHLPLPQVYPHLGDAEKAAVKREVCAHLLRATER